MILFRKAEALTKYVGELGSRGVSTGFVPTMGALHPGHISLIRLAKAQNDIVICSIFINPAQFNDAADFEKYPVTTQTDIGLLEAADCDILFFPSVQEIYPSGLPERHYDLGYLEKILEGKYRPGHFQGVCKVIDRLVSIISPQKFYLGQKDYQQCMVVRRLLAILGLEAQIELVIAPTLREPDGLAMSSRNTRLDPKQRSEATAIYRALASVKAGLNKEPVQLLISRAVASLESEGFRVDYVEIASASDLRPLKENQSPSEGVALAAAFLGEVRLIDNLLLSPQE